MSIVFSGTPQLYKRQAVLVAVGVHVWVYILFVATKFLAQGENWLGVWQLAAGFAVSTVIMGLLHYRWVMRLDAQYGKGSAWDLKEVTVKLPVLKPRR